MPSVELTLSYTKIFLVLKKLLYNFLFIVAHGLARSGPRAGAHGPPAGAHGPRAGARCPPAGAQGNPRDGDATRATSISRACRQETYYSSMRGDGDNNTCGGRLTIWRILGDNSEFAYASHKCDKIQCVLDFC